MGIFVSSHGARAPRAASGHGRSLIAALVVLTGASLPCRAGYSFHMLADLTAAPHPFAGLTFDASGNLYGTTQLGGTGNHGTVYRIAAGSQAFGVVADLSYSSGYYTYGSLVVDPSDNIFGVGYLGGGVTGNPGAVFEVPSGSNTAGKIAMLPGTETGGVGGLTIDGNGNLYGAEFRSLSSSNGLLYKVDPASHSLSVLATFDGANGSDPESALAVDDHGNLFGTTRAGGADDLGTVFKYSAVDHSITALASFNGTNGSGPESGLVIDAAGNMYGTASSGGANNLGVIFELPAGSNTLVTLASFDGTNGSKPIAGLLLDGNGNLFGTTSAGGAFQRGTVFELPAGSGTITDLYAFSGPDGWEPDGTLVADPAGNLYGTTMFGGSGYTAPDRGEGTVFELAYVPEPGSCALMVLAGSLACLRQRRGRRHDRSE